jgi:hypothetical protein
LMAFVTVGLNLCVTLIRGENPFFDVKRCSTMDWTLFGLFVVLMLLMSAIGLVWNRKE